MCITVTIDEDILAIAKALSEQDGVSLGRALSELARRGQRATTATVESDGPPVFAVPPDAKRITIDDVHKALGDWP